MPLGPLLELALQLCVGIGEIHAAGWIHRDLKPSNVLVENVGDTRRVRIVDFGIVRESHTVPESNNGFVLGTPHYMAPEQAINPRAVDVRTDIWAVGVILYEMLSGCLPFPTTSRSEYLTALALDPPTPLEDVRPNLHPSLYELVAQCLSKNIAGRPADVGAVAVQLVTAKPSLAVYAERVQTILKKPRRQELPETPSGRIAGAPALMTKQTLLDAFGPDVHERAIATLGPEERREYEEMTPVGWVRTSTTTAVVNATAGLVGVDAEALSDEIARRGSEHAFRSTWKPFSADVSDEALARRCSVVYEKSRGLGTLEGRLLSEGRMEAVLTGWPDATERELRHISVALEVVAGLAGRERVRCTWTRTPVGARYECSWSPGLALSESHG
jgi:hypothetical protein